MGRDDLEQLFVSKPNGSIMVKKTLNHPALDFAMYLADSSMRACLCLAKPTNHPPVRLSQCNACPHQESSLPLDDEDLVQGLTWHPSAAARYTHARVVVCRSPTLHPSPAAPLRPSVGTDETHHRHHFVISAVLLILVCKGIRGCQQNSAAGN